MATQNSHRPFFSNYLDNRASYYLQFKTTCNDTGSKENNGIINIITQQSTPFTKSKGQIGTQLAQVSKLINKDDMSGRYANKNNQVHYLHNCIGNTTFNPSGRKTAIVIHYLTVTGKTLAKRVNIIFSERLTRILADE